MRTLLILLTALLLIGCDSKEYLIENKFVDEDNPSLSKFYYRVGWTNQYSIDSTHKFNVGDDIRKYKKPCEP